MNLFERQERTNREQALPLAARMRPRTLEEYVGQMHFLAQENCSHALGTVGCNR